VLRGVLTAHRLWEPIARDVHTLPERKDIGRALTAEEEWRLLEATRQHDSACHTATVLALNTSMGRTASQCRANPPCVPLARQRAG